MTFMPLIKSNPMYVYKHDTFKDERIVRSLIYVLGPKEQHYDDMYKLPVYFKGELVFSVNILGYFIPYVRQLCLREANPSSTSDVFQYWCVGGSSSWGNCTYGLRDMVDRALNDGTIVDYNAANINALRAPVVTDKYKLAEYTKLYEMFPFAYLQEQKMTYQISKDAGALATFLRKICEYWQ